MVVGHQGNPGAKFPDALPPLANRYLICFLNPTHQEFGVLLAALAYELGRQFHQHVFKFGFRRRKLCKIELLTNFTGGGFYLHQRYFKLLCIFGRKRKWYCRQVGLTLDFGDARQHEGEVDINLRLYVWWQRFGRMGVFLLGLFEFVGWVWPISSTLLIFLVSGCFLRSSLALCFELTLASLLGVL